MFMWYYGGVVRHQFGNPSKPQALPVALEPIIQLAGCGYDNKVDKEPMEDSTQAATADVDLPDELDQPVDSGDKGSGLDDSDVREDRDEDEEAMGVSDDEDDHNDVARPEDSEAEMGEDEHELASAGFAPW